MIVDTRNKEMKVIVFNMGVANFILTKILVVKKFYNTYLWVYFSFN